MRSIWIVAFALLLGTVSAQFNFGGICNDLFGSPVNLPYQNLLSISVAIVLLVLMIMGIVYTFGLGFGIDSLKAFVRTEVLESVFNLVLIAFVASGLAFAGGAISFLSNVAGIGLSASAAPSCGSSSITTAADVYLSICDCYINKGIGSVFPYVISTSTSLILINTFKSTLIIAEPNEFGFEGFIFAGLEPVSQLISMQLSFFMLLIGFFIGIPVLLWVIYGLFPWFLYVGVALRSMPWTRSAGGSFIALFIAFYIVFPAIIYPFSAYSSQSTFCPPGYDPANCVNPTLGAFDILSFASTAITTVISAFLTGGYGELIAFAGVASTLVVQLLGMVIALLVSLDLVEVLGDTLGAPSLHTKKLLSKVI